MITTLVPAFKIEFFSQLLNSLSRQEHRPDQVLISDDTVRGDFAAAVFQNYEIRRAASRINGQIIPGPKRGHHENIRFLIGEYLKQPTEFFHIFLDDDQIAPSFYKDHLHAHQARFSLCSVSRRLSLSQKTGKTRLPPIPIKLEETSPGLACVSLDQIVKTFVIDGTWNWFGELTCMILRRAFLDIDKDFNSFAGIALEGLNDICTLIKSASVADILFITKPNGLFLFNQTSISARKGYFYSLSILVIVPMTISLYRKSKLTSAQVMEILLRTRERWKRTYGSDLIYRRLDELLVMGERNYDDFEHAAVDFWSAYKQLSTISGQISHRDALIKYLATEDISLITRHGQ